MYPSKSLSGVLTVAFYTALAAAAAVAQTTRPVTTQPLAQVVTSQPVAGPVIAVDQAEHDFGQVWAGEKLQHTFKITNTARSDLKITNVKPTCGCTIAGDYPRTLAPGASGVLPFSLVTANMNGPFNKSIALFSNDPAKPVLMLSLKGKALPRIAISPPGVYLSAIRDSQPQTRTAKRGHH